MSRFEREVGKVSASLQNLLGQLDRCIFGDQCRLSLSGANSGSDAGDGFTFAKSSARPGASGRKVNPEVDALTTVLRSRGLSPAALKATDENGLKALYRVASQTCSDSPSSKPSNQVSFLVDGDAISMLGKLLTRKFEPLRADDLENLAAIMERPIGPERARLVLNLLSGTRANPPALSRQDLELLASTERDVYNFAHADDEGALDIRIAPNAGPLHITVTLDILGDVHKEEKGQEAKALRRVAYHGGEIGSLNHVLHLLGTHNILRARDHAQVIVPTTSELETLLRSQSETEPTQESDRHTRNTVMSISGRELKSGSCHWIFNARQPQQGAPAGVQAMTHLVETLFATDGESGPADALPASAPARVRDVPTGLTIQDLLTDPELAKDLHSPRLSERIEAFHELVEMIKLYRTQLEQFADNEVVAKVTGFLNRLELSTDRGAGILTWFKDRKGKLPEAIRSAYENVASPATTLSLAEARVCWQGLLLYHIQNTFVDQGKVFSGFRSDLAIWKALSESDPLRDMFPELAKVEAYLSSLDSNADVVRVSEYADALANSQLYDFRVAMNRRILDELPQTRQDIEGIVNLLRPLFHTEHGRFRADCLQLSLPVERLKTHILSGKFTLDARTDRTNETVGAWSDEVEQSGNSSWSSFLTREDLRAGLLADFTREATSTTSGDELALLRSTCIEDFRAQTDALLLLKRKVYFLREQLRSRWTEIDTTGAKTFNEFFNNLIALDDARPIVRELSPPLSRIRGTKATLMPEESFLQTFKMSPYEATRRLLARGSLAVLLDQGDGVSEPAVRVATAEAWKQWENETVPMLTITELGLLPKKYFNLLGLAAERLGELRPADGYPDFALAKEIASSPLIMLDPGAEFILQRMYLFPEECKKVEALAALEDLCIQNGLIRTEELSELSNFKKRLQSEFHTYSGGFELRPERTSEEPAFRLHCCADRPLPQSHRDGPIQYYKPEELRKAHDNFDAQYRPLTDLSDEWIARARFLVSAEGTPSLWVHNIRGKTENTQFYVHGLLSGNEHSRSLKRISTDFVAAVEAFAPPIDQLDASRRRGKDINVKRGFNVRFQGDIPVFAFGKYGPAKKDDAAPRPATAISSVALDDPGYLRYILQSMQRAPEHLKQIATKALELVESEQPDEVKEVRKKAIDSALCSFIDANHRSWSS